MSQAILDQSPSPARALEGIGCILLGMILFVAQDGIMKALLETHVIWLMIAARGVMAFVILAPLIIWLGGPRKLLSALWPLHLIRAVLLTLGFSLFYAAFPFMGLAEVSTIFFSAPLIIAMLAVVWLGETIGPHRIGALIVGFAGVLIAMNPTSDAFQWVALLPLACAFCYALAQILARQIGDRESSLTAGFQTVAFSGLMILPAGWLLNQFVDTGTEFSHLGWHFPALEWPSFLAITFLGVNGMAGFLLLTRAYQVTSASLVAPFDYSYLPFATLMAFVVWAEVPSIHTIIGMVLIILSGLYLGYRELRSARSTLDPLPVAESSVVPGNPVAPLTLGNHLTDRD